MESLLASRSRCAPTGSDGVCSGGQEAAIQEDASQRGRATTRLTGPPAVARRGPLATPCSKEAERGFALFHALVDGETGGSGSCSTGSGSRSSAETAFGEASQTSACAGSIPLVSGVSPGSGACGLEVGSEPRRRLSFVLPTFGDACDDVLSPLSKPLHAAGVSAGLTDSPDSEGSIALSAQPSREGCETQDDAEGFVLSTVSEFSSGAHRQRGSSSSGKEAPLLPPPPQPGLDQGLIATAGGLLSHDILSPHDLVLLGELPRQLADRYILSMDEMDRKRSAALTRADSLEATALRARSRRDELQQAWAAQELSMLRRGLQLPGMLLATMLVVLYAVVTFLIATPALASDLASAEQCGALARRQVNVSLFSVRPSACMGDLVQAETGVDRELRLSAQDVKGWHQMVESFHTYLEVITQHAETPEQQLQKRCLGGHLQRSQALAVQLKAGFEEDQSALLSMLGDLRSYRREHLRLNGWRRVGMEDPPEQH
eukprot:TRINITY_DN17694_c0_g1_i1.p1 TRINITY_DN17694_c0_g1~~TRINITY_DN17694_c0_g1_i1.p1  ORF type:complete len:489 (-),score=98.48 TRINITY_DN17694_c0_g1_i1:299-1765(-)